VAVEASSLPSHRLIKDDQSIHFSNIRKTHPIMKVLRRRPRAALATLGVLLIVLPYAVDRTIPYGYSTSPGAYALHVGTFAVLLAGTTALLARTAGRPDYRAAAAAVLALAVLYLLAVGVAWYDLAVASSTSAGSAPTLAELAVDRLVVPLLLTPLVSGYVLGAFDAAGADGRSAAVPTFAVALVVVGPVGANAVAASVGIPHGLAFLAYASMAVASVVVALVFYLVARWVYAANDVTVTANTE
jgi:hypothetical protein